MIRWLSILLVILGCTHPPARADQVELQGGDVLHGKVLAQDEQHIVLEHPALGRMEFKRAQVTGIRIDPPPAAPPAPATNASPSPAPPPAPEGEIPAPPALPAPVPPGIWDGWKSSVDLGISGEEGTNERLTFRLGFRTKRETAQTRTNFNARYILGTNRDNRDRHEWNLGLNQDWLLPDSPWFIFAQGLHEFDEFKDWEQRLSGNAGAGYELIKDEKMFLRLRTGPGMSMEFAGAQSGLAPEWLVGLEWEWKPVKNHKFNVGNNFIQDLSRGDRHRNKATVIWTIKLEEASGVSLRLALEDDYNSTPAQGRFPHDLKYFGSIQLDF